MRKKLVIINIMLLAILTAYGQSQGISCESNCDYADSKKKQTSFEISLEKIPTEREIIYHKAKNLYLSGKWDGLPIFIFGHFVEFLPRSGSLCVDGFIVMPTEDLHLPEIFDINSIDSNIEYIPGKGEYAIKGSKLVKFVRQEMVEIGILNCKGLDIKNINIQLNDYGFNNRDYVHDYVHEIPYLYYDEVSDKLILVTMNSFSNYLYSYNLYIFPDYTKPETEELGIIRTFDIIHTGERDTFYYTDLEANDWKYEKDGPERFIPEN